MGEIHLNNVLYLTDYNQSIFISTWKQYLKITIEMFYILFS